MKAFLANKLADMLAYYGNRGPLYRCAMIYRKSGFKLQGNLLHMIMMMTAGASTSSLAICRLLLAG